MQTFLSFDAPAAAAGAPAAASMTLVSFDVRADFGFLRKPDVNFAKVGDGSKQIGLTYNLLHKPALLGILGSILGLEGYSRYKQRPEYWEKLMHIKVGIAPLQFFGNESKETGFIPRHERGSFSKINMVYTNTTGFGNKDKNGNPSTWVLYEDTLIRPAYRCFVLLDRANAVEELLHQRLLRQEADYLPYLGKNEFALSWDNVQVLPDARPFAGGQEFQVVSAFRKTSRVSDAVARAVGLRARQGHTGEPPFLHFERLPVGFDEHLMQYRYAEFVYSNARFQADAPIEDLFGWRDGQAVQLH